MFEFATLFSVPFSVLISAAVTVSTKQAEFYWLGEAQFFVQLERLIHYYYQVWPPSIKILNLKPNRFLSPTIPILRIGVSYLIQDHLRTYY